MLQSNQQLKRKYNQEIKKIAEVLKKKYNPQKVILYGSAATDKVTKDSDIDLLIIKKSSLKRMERMREVSDLFLNRSIPFEPIVFTPEEFERELSYNPVMKAVVNSGRILYES